MPKEIPLAELPRAVEALALGRARALLLVGPSGAGKTGLVLELVAGLRDRGVAVGGVVTPRVLVDGTTRGYRVRDLATGEETLLCSLDPPGIPFRRFFFSPKGIELGNHALERAVRARLAVVDELGPLELSGGGFAPGLSSLRSAGPPLIVTVRPWLLEEALDWLEIPQDTPMVRVG